RDHRCERERRRPRASLGERIWRLDMLARIAHVELTASLPAPQPRASSEADEPGNQRAKPAGSPEQHRTCYAHRVSPSVVVQATSTTAETLSDSWPLSSASSISACAAAWGAALGESAFWIVSWSTQPCRPSLQSSRRSPT